MTTLIDDGLPESCLDDPVSLKGFDQFSVIDIDNIDATIEDPGYILDEGLNMLNQNEEYTSSYKKRSFALPVKFFDISRNISLLKKCRPISVKIVDCHIYPWYYKEIKNNIISHKDEDSNQYELCNHTIDLVSSTCCDTISSPTTSFSNINLSSEQRFALSKSKEKFVNDTYANKYIVDNVNKENNNIRNHSDSLLLNTDISEYGFDKRMESEDLLKYKSIAQTIVSNIDHNEATLNLNIGRDSIIDLSIDVEKSDRHNIGKEKEEREKILTSPILPYSVKLQKKIKTNGGMIRKSPNSNSVLEKCTDLNKKCDKFMSSTNRVIPHYHCRLPVPENNYNNNYYFTSTVGNKMDTQNPTTQDRLPYCQPIIKSGILSGNNELLQARNPQERLVTYPNSIGQVSHLDYNKIPTYTRFLNSSQNINPNIHTPISYVQFYYQNNIHTAEYLNQSKVKIGNSSRHFRRANTDQVISKEKAFPQPCTVSKSACHNYVPNSMRLLKEYVNYSNTQNPLQRNVSNMTNMIQSNPLISQILNSNNLTEYYQSAMKPYGEVVSGSVVGSIPLSKDQNLRPPPLPYDYYLWSTQYAQNNRFEHSNAGMNFHGFSNSEDTNLLQQKTNSNFRCTEFPNGQLRGENNIKSIPIRAPTLTNSITPRVYSMNRNACTNTEMKNINQISSTSREVTDPEMLNSMKTKINNQHSITVFTESAKVDTKTTKKNNIDSVINMLSNNTSNCVNSKMDKCNNMTQSNTFSVLKENTFNLLEQQKIPDRYQLDTTPIADGALKISNPVLQPKKNVNIATSEQVQSKILIKGYSPPILPIPSFKKSLEMLSELQHAPAINSTTNTYLGTKTQKTCSSSKQMKKGQEYTDIIRKRKLNNDGKMSINSKRISLQEYKLRRLDNVITLV